MMTRLEGVCLLACTVLIAIASLMAERYIGAAYATLFAGLAPLAIFYLDVARRHKKRKKAPDSDQ